MSRPGSPCRQYWIPPQAGMRPPRASPAPELQQVVGQAWPGPDSLCPERPPFPPLAALAAQSRWMVLLLPTARPHQRQFLRCSTTAAARERRRLESTGDQRFRLQRIRRPVRWQNLLKLLQLQRHSAAAVAHEPKRKVWRKRHFPERPPRMKILPVPKQAQRHRRRAATLKQRRGGRRRDAWLPFARQRRARLLQTQRRYLKQPHPRKLPESAPPSRGSYRISRSAVAGRPALRRLQTAPMLPTQTGRRSRR